MQSAHNSSKMLEEAYATGVAVLSKYSEQRDRIKVLLSLHVAGEMAQLLESGPLWVAEPPIAWNKKGLTADLLLNAESAEEGAGYPQYRGPLELAVEAHREAAPHRQVDCIWRDAIGDCGCVYVLEVDPLIHLLPVR